MTRPLTSNTVDTPLIGVHECHGVCQFYGHTRNKRRGPSRFDHGRDAASPPGGTRSHRGVPERWIVNQTWVGLAGPAHTEFSPHRR